MRICIIAVTDNRATKDKRNYSAYRRLFDLIETLPNYGEDIEEYEYFFHFIPEDTRLKAYTKLYNVPSRIFEISYKPKKKRIEAFKPIDLVQFLKGGIENAVRVLAKAVLEGIIEYDYLRRKPKDFDRDAFYNDVVKKFIENGIFAEKEIEDIRNLCFRFDE